MYVDAMLDTKNDLVKVVERKNGVRIYQDYPVEHYFYVKDQQGGHRDIYGNQVKKIVPKSKEEKIKIIKSYPEHKLCESDINPTLRCLEKHYLNVPEPNLHVAFFDIETEYDREFGYSSAEDALNRIISIAVHLQWLNRTVCITIPPSTLSDEEAQTIADEVGDTVLVNNEYELLDMFLAIIEDADIISGWNSEKFDILYIVNRVFKVLGKHDSRRMCLWNMMPKKKEVIEKTDDDEEQEVLYYTYELKGRVHLDYMMLYKKYTYEQKQSYSLDNIASLEIGETKVPYDGTLDHMYKYDFKKFLQYNIQDTLILNKLDKRLQYISLANGIAHNNVVLFSHTMGTVTTTEQAIIIEAHANNKVVPNKRRSDVDPRAAGGWTPNPKKGLHKYVCNTDMNSLYPSTIRALNMSPETLIGQIRLDETTDALNKFLNKGKRYKFSMFWHNKFNVMEMEYVFSKDISVPLILDMSDGNSYSLTGAEIYKLVFESGKPWSISANGTIFRHDIAGVIPSLLARWYKERKMMQAKQKLYAKFSTESKLEERFTSPEWFTFHKMDIEKDNPYELNTACDADRLKALMSGDDNDALNMYLNSHGLIVQDGYIVCGDEELNSQIEAFWDKRQLVRKINLNSVYGGLLNAHHRFFDQRIGQSTTLTGRSICRHMAAKTNEIITGDYDYKGSSIIYGDTDSCYFSAYETLKQDIDSGKIDWAKETVIALYDSIASEVCETFAQFALETFNIPLNNGSVLRSAREVVASSGLFVKRKKYALMVFDKEGKRQDVDDPNGKFKVTGLEIRRSDTPKEVQKFLEKTLKDVLCGVSEQVTIENIKAFKESYASLPSWKKGIPKGVNGLNYYTDAVMKQLDKKKVDGKKVTVPGHVRASINWNVLRDLNRDNTSMRILDGSKIVVCKLKVTPNNTFTSIAYPIDELHLPEWFKELPFDDDEMVKTVIDMKLQNIIGVLHIDLTLTNSRQDILDSLFDFSSFK